MNKASKSRLVKTLLITTSILIGFIVSVIIITYSQQDRIVNDMITRLNHDFEGKLSIEDSHISPFVNFSYISIDLENIQIYESKSDTSEMLMQVQDSYIGFDLFSILSGSFEAKKVKLENGFLKLVQHTDGSFNIANAMSSEEEYDEDLDSEPTHLDLQQIELVNIDLLKLNQESNMLVEAFIEDAQSSFKINNESTEIFLDSKFLFNLIIDSDTSFLHNKHVELHTTLNLNAENNVLSISQSEVFIENALFLMEGAIDVDDDMDLDLKFGGNKPNFDLFLAFAPPELDPVLSRYDNGGKIYFDALIKGRSINGFSPAINVDFGCSEAFVRNTTVDKTVNDLYFEGHFTNGESRDAETMALIIEDFTASPETGVFKGNISIENFDSPEFDIQLISEFDLDFLAKFLNINNLEDITGNVSLEMNFHDIIDLSQPEKSIERLNESYYTKLDVKNLNVRSSVYPLPITDVNIRGEMDGHKAEIEQLDFKVGKSDLSITASVSDLPAILHHTDTPIEAILDITSNLIDLNELTSSSGDSTSGFNEQIKDMGMRFKFKSSARAFTESPNLPLGEFFIEKLSAQLTNYPHRLHDFNADVFVDSANFRIIDFTGMIDQSDFHFTGKLKNYDLWFEENPTGDTMVDFNLNSDLLQLDDLFDYGGENYVPEDYRHEEFKNLNLHGLAAMKFNQKLNSTKVDIDKLEATMKIHPLRFEKFSGQFYIDSTHIEVNNLGGQLGKSDFISNFKYYFDADSIERTHSFELISNKLDFDQLFAYNPPPADKEMTPEDHEAGFNIFEVPFSNMTFKFDIKSLNYHRYLLDDFFLKGRMQTDHYVYIDTMRLKAAGGNIGLNGYFNGSDPKAIYFSPNMTVDNLDLDKLLFKFENFGQDHLVSENLHGNLSGTLNGKIHMHADMVPIIDDSELHMDFNVYNGSINNYSMFDALSDYFADKNLSNVRFDTLQNELDLNNGTLSIPSMNINSTIGYFEISGEQGVDLDMLYYVRIPLKVVTRAGFSKLFGKKDRDNSDQVDEIEYRDPSKKTSFINLKIEGTPENYNISLGKDKN